MRCARSVIVVVWKKDDKERRERERKREKMESSDGREREYERAEASMGRVPEAVLNFVGYAVITWPQKYLRSLTVHVAHSRCKNSASLYSLCRNKDKLIFVYKNICCLKKIEKKMLDTFTLSVNTSVFCCSWFFFLLSSSSSLIFNSSCWCVSVEGVVSVNSSCARWCTLFRLLLPAVPRMSDVSMMLKNTASFTVPVHSKNVDSESGLHLLSAPSSLLLSSHFISSPLSYHCFSGTTKENTTVCTFTLLYKAQNSIEIGSALKR